MATTWMGFRELNTVPDPEVLQFGYFKQLQYFKPMAEDTAHYKRARWNGSPDHSFEWLWVASCRYLSMKREDYMQDSLNRSLKHSHAKALPGLDASEPKKGKGDNTGKGKPRSKTPSRPTGGGTRPKGGSRERSQSKECKGNN